jgi:hypothetical protein
LPKKSISSQVAGKVATRNTKMANKMALIMVGHSSGCKARRKDRGYCGYRLRRAIRLRPGVLWHSGVATSLACDQTMPVVLISAGAVLIVLTFLLVFTIYGFVAAVVGLVCIALRAVMLSRRTPGPRAD